MPTTSSIEDVIADALGVDTDQLVPDANLVTDLDAKPEDFLTIQFNLRHELGVNLSLGQIADTLLAGAPASTWKYAFDQGYIDILPDEVRAMQERGVDEPIRPMRGSEGEPCTVARLTALARSCVQATV